MDWWYTIVDKAGMRIKLVVDKSKKKGRMVLNTIRPCGLFKDKPGLITAYPRR